MQHGMRAHGPLHLVRVGDGDLGTAAATVLRR